MGCNRLRIELCCHQLLHVTAIKKGDKMKFSGPSNPTRGNGGSTTFKSPASGEIRGMARCSEGLNANTNKTHARAAHQSGKGGPNFKGTAGNPVRRG